MSEIKTLEGYYFVDVVARKDIATQRSELDNVTAGTIVTDKTLTVEGAAADAKAVGDRVDALSDRVTQLEDNPGTGSSGGSSNVQIDTTLKIAGAAADSKSVGDEFTSMLELISTVGQNLNGLVEENSERISDHEQRITTLEDSGVGGGNGSDGFSPIVTVTEIDGGHTVSIQDAEGVKSFDVMDGASEDVESLNERLTDVEENLASQEVTTTNLESAALMKAEYEENREADLKLISTTDESVAALEAKHDGKIAALETRASNLESSVLLKADYEQNRTADLELVANANESIATLRTEHSDRIASVETKTNELEASVMLKSEYDENREADLKLISDANDSVAALEAKHGDQIAAQELTANEHESKLTAQANSINLMGGTVDELGEWKETAAIKIDGLESNINLKADKTTVDDIGERVSAAEVDIDGLDAKIKLIATESSISELEERISQAEIDIDGAEAAIELKANQSAVDDMGERISAAEVDIDGLNAKIKLIATEESISELEERVSQAEIDIDGAEAAIKLKADQSVVDAQGERLSQAEIDINGAEAAINLKADKTTVDSMGSRLTSAEAQIDGANALIVLKANKSDLDAVDDRVSAAEVEIDGLDAKIKLLATESSISELEERVSQAEIDINGAEAAIKLKADKTVTDGLTTRMSNAEADIDAANAAIELKASKSDLVTMGNRVTQAEIDIDGAKADIALKAAQADFDGLDARVTQAEIDIDGANSAITLKASQSDVNALGNRMSSAELRIDGAESEITAQAETIKLKADQSDVNGLKTQTSELQVKYNQISTKVEDNEGNISTLTQTSTEFSTRLEDAEDNVSSLSLTVDGMSSTVSNTAGEVSTLKNTVSGLSSTVSNNTGKISTLENTVDGLTSTVVSNSGQISTLKNTIDGLESTVDDNAGNISTLTNTVNGLNSTVKNNTGNISTLTNTVNGLNSTVSSHTGSISTLENTVDGLSSDVEDANGNISTLTNTVNGLNSTVSSHTGNISTLTNSVNGLTNRVEDAEGNITTLQTTATSFEARVQDAEGQVAALSATVDEHGSKIAAQAETIELKADSDDLDAVVVRLNEAEGTITLQAETINAHTKTINTHAQEINARATQVYVDGLVANLVTTQELKAVQGSISDLTGGLVTASALKANALTGTTVNTTNLNADVIKHNGVLLSRRSITMGDITTTGRALSDGAMDLSHSHKVSVNDDGTITLGEVATEGGSFKIADTKYYKDGVSAAKNDVYVLSMTGSGGVITAKLSNEREGTMFLTTGEPVGNIIPVVDYPGGTTIMNVDAQDIYDLGLEEGRKSGEGAGVSSITLKKSWNAGVLVVTGESNLSDIKKTITAQLSKGTETWNDNVCTFQMFDYQASTGYTCRVDASERFDAGAKSVTLTAGEWNNNKMTVTASNDEEVEVDASGIYSSGRAAGVSSVTLSGLGWQNGTYTVKASNDKTFAVSHPTVTLSGGTSWNTSNQTTVYASSNATTGFLRSLTVDASSVYTNGYNVGYANAKPASASRVATYDATNNEYDVTASVKSTDGTSYIFTLTSISASSAYAAGVDSVTLAEGEWADNKMVVTASNGQALTVDASAIYSSAETAGYTSGFSAGKDSVTLTQNGWQNGANIVSASNGKSTTVNLPTFTTSGGTSWSNNKTTVYFYTSSVSGALKSVTVDASSIYKAGGDAVTLTEGEWSSNKKTITASNGKVVNVDASSIFVAGANSVTISSAGWTNGSNVINASNGESVTISHPTVTLSGGTSWNASNKTTVYAYSNAISGYLTYKTIDASSVYTKGVTAGAESVTLTAGEWSDNKMTVSASNGESAEVDASEIYSSGYTDGWGDVVVPNSNIVRQTADYYAGGSDYATTVYIKASASNGSYGTQSFTVSGKSAYDAGHTAGANSVTLSAGEWSSNKQVITATNGETIEVDASGIYASGYNDGWIDVVVPNRNIVRQTTDYYTGDADHSTTVYIKATASNNAYGTQSFSVSGKSAYNAGLSAGEKSVTLSEGEWSDNKMTVTASNGETLIVDASDIYSEAESAGFVSGFNAGKGSVTLTSNGWTNGSNIVSASNGQSVTVSLPTFTTSGGTSWSNNKTTVYFYTSSVSGPLKSVTVDASSIYKAGGDAVTLTEGTWSSNKKTVTASNGKSVTVDASSIFTNGKNSVTISAAGWTNGTNIVTASNGESVTVSHPTVTISGGTSWNTSHKTTVYASSNATSGYLTSKVVDASSVYTDGVTAGEANVTLTAGDWSSNKKTITASNGKSIEVDASAIYDAGQNAGANSLAISPSTDETLAYGASKTITATTTNAAGTSVTKSVKITAPADRYDEGETNGILAVRNNSVLSIEGTGVAAKVVAKYSGSKYNEISLQSFYSGGVTTGATSAINNASLSLAVGNDGKTATGTISTNGVDTTKTISGIDVSDAYNAGEDSVTIPNTNIVRQAADVYTGGSNYATTVYIRASASNGAYGTQSFSVSGKTAYDYGKNAGANSLTISPTEDETLDYAKSKTITATTINAAGNFVTKSITLTAPADRYATGHSDATPASVSRVASYDSDNNAYAVHVVVKAKDGTTSEFDLVAIGASAAYDAGYAAGYQAAKDAVEVTAGISWWSNPAQNYAMVGYWGKALIDGEEVGYASGTDSRNVSGYV